MIYALRKRAPDAKSLLLADIDVSSQLGVGRSTLWRWISQDRFPAPIRIGRVKNPTTGGTKSIASRWSADDVRLFVQCKCSMTEFRKRKLQQG